MFSIRQKMVTLPDYHDQTGAQYLPVLDMTVTNRSNDLIWGLLGANFVHFSILMEYMAARLGAEVGLYHHFTNNLHCYESNWKPDEWLKDEGWGYSSHGLSFNGRSFPENIRTDTPLVKNPEAFECELPLLVGHFAGPDRKSTPLEEMLGEPFLGQVAGRMFNAFDGHKSGNKSWAMKAAEGIAADDWRIACTEWLKRRQK